MEKTKSWHHQIHWDVQEITVNHLTNQPKPRVCRRWYSSWFSSLRGKSLLSLLPVKRFWSPCRGRVWLDAGHYSLWPASNFHIEAPWLRCSPHSLCKSMQPVWPMPMGWDQYQPKRPEETMVSKIHPPKASQKLNVYKFICIQIHIYTCIFIYIYTHIYNIQWYTMISYLVYISLSAPYHLS